MIIKQPKIIIKLCEGSIYSRYHTMTDVYTTVLLLTKPSSDDDSGFRHGFGTKASLPLTQSTPAVSYDTTRLCQIVVALWECHIHADAVKSLILDLFHVFSLVRWRKSKISKENGGWVIYIYIYIYIYI